VAAGDAGLDEQLEQHMRDLRDRSPDGFWVDARLLPGFHPHTGAGTDGTRDAQGRSLPDVERQLQAGNWPGR
jgi:hypothetical protein